MRIQQNIKLNVSNKQSEILHIGNNRYKQTNEQTKNLPTRQYAIHNVVCNTLSVMDHFLSASVYC